MRVRHFFTVFAAQVPFHVIVEIRQPQLPVECPLCKKIAGVASQASESQPSSRRVIRVEVLIFV